MARGSIPPEDTILKSNMIIDSIVNNELGVDDVVLNSNLFRMERMSDTSFWLAAYNGNIRTTFDLSIQDGKLIATLIEDHK